MIEMSESCADILSAKGLAFIKDIEAVCKLHGVQLSVSDYDALQIWPLESGDSCLYAPVIDDVLGTDA